MSQKEICRFEAKSMFDMPPFYTLVYFADRRCDFTSPAAEAINNALDIRSKVLRMRLLCGCSINSSHALFLGGVFNLFVKECGDSIAKLSDIESAVFDLKTYFDFVDPTNSILLFPIGGEYDGIPASEIKAVFERVFEGVDVTVVFCNV
mgnify:CR=1 FL=1